MSLQHGFEDDRNKELNDDVEMEKQRRERQRREQRKRMRRERDQAMRDLGLVKVKGNLGGTYWE